MSDLDKLPLDAVFRPRSDHGLTLPANAVVLSAQFGRTRANIWMDDAPSPIWGERHAGALSEIIGHITLPVWRIFAGYGAIATSENVAKYKAEAIARDINQMSPAPLSNPASSEDILRDSEILLRRSEAAHALRREWLAALPSEEPAADEPEYCGFDAPM